MASLIFRKKLHQSIIQRLFLLKKNYPIISTHVKKLLFNMQYRPKQFFSNMFLLSIAGVKTADEVEDHVDRNNSSRVPGDDLSFIGAASRFKPSKSYDANDTQLSSTQCLKNAVGLAVDATSAVLSQTVYQILDAEQEYIQLVNVLITLLEYQIQVLGHGTEEQKMADLVIEARNEMTQAHQKKQELGLLFSSVEKLAEATAEVAFAAGADYASISSSERLHSALMEKKRIQQLSESAEYRLHLMQVKVIEKTTKHEESKKKRNKLQGQEKNEIKNIQTDET